MRQRGALLWNVCTVLLLLGVAGGLAMGGVQLLAATQSMKEHRVLLTSRQQLLQEIPPHARGIADLQAQLDRAQTEMKALQGSLPGLEDRVLLSKWIRSAATAAGVALQGFSLEKGEETGSFTVVRANVVLITANVEAVITFVEIMEGYGVPMAVTWGPMPYRPPLQLTLSIRFYLLQV